MRDTYIFCNFQPSRTYTKKDGGRATIPTQVVFLVPSEDDRVVGMKPLEMQADVRMEPQLAGLRSLQKVEAEFSFDKQQFGQNARVTFFLHNIQPED